MGFEVVIPLHQRLHPVGDCIHCQLHPGRCFNTAGAGIWTHDLRSTHEGDRGLMDHQRAQEMDLCHVCGQGGQQTDESNQQTEPANRPATCRCIIWTIWARPANCHQRKHPRQWNERVRTAKSAESAASAIAQTAQVTSPAPVRGTGSRW